MNNADLVWRLVELLLQKEKDLNQVALDQAENHNNKPNATVHLALFDYPMNFLFLT